MHESLRWVIVYISMSSFLIMFMFRISHEMYKSEIWSLGLLLGGVSWGVGRVSLGEETITQIGGTPLPKLVLTLFTFGQNQKWKSCPNCVRGGEGGSLGNAQRNDGIFRGVFLLLALLLARWTDNVAYWAKIRGQQQVQSTLVKYI